MVIGRLKSLRRIAKKRHLLLVKDFLSLRGCLSDSATRQLPQFQRLMDRVLKDLKWSECLVYIDDIVIFGRTFDEHLYHDMLQTFSPI